MKFVVALLLLVLASYLVGFFLPQTYEVERSQVIAASPEAVHALVNDLHTWADWSDFKPPAEANVETESSFEGPQKGEGAAWIWGGLGDIKPARLEILASNPQLGIAYKLSMDGGRVDTTGEVRYEPDPLGIKVTLSNKGEMATPWSRYFTFLAERSIGPTFERSLKGLKEAVEAPKPAGAAGTQTPSTGAPETPQAAGDEVSKEPVHAESEH